MSAPDSLPPLSQHLRSPVTRAVLRIQDAVLTEARIYLADQGFVELLAPIIGPVTDPGTRGSKQVDVDYYGHRYRLMTSAILYKQASLLAFEKIFYVAPNVRLEPLETASTGRHLTEFHQLDVEMAGATREEAMALAEEIVRRAVRRLVGDFAPVLEELGRDAGAFTELLGSPFGRLTHAEAAERLNELGHAQSREAEIDWEGEVVLSRKAGSPFFITDYPKGCRGFYDRESDELEGVLRSFDLIAPEGCGEIVSGGERESDYARLVTRMRETGENPAKYRWYLDLAREGLPRSAGFGLGVERLVRYLAGQDYVWRATAFPKLAGVVSP